MRRGNKDVDGSMQGGGDGGKKGDAAHAQEPSETQLTLKMPIKQLKNAQAHEQVTHESKAKARRKQAMGEHTDESQKM